MAGREPDRLVRPRIRPPLRSLQRDARSLGARPPGGPDDAYPHRGRGEPLLLPQPHPDRAYHHADRPRDRHARAPAGLERSRMAAPLKTQTPDSEAPGPRGHFLLGATPALRRAPLATLVQAWRDYG